MDEIDKVVGEKLRALREKRGYSTREVEKRTGISYSYVAKIENGKFPSLTILNKLCDLYNVDLPTLLDSNNKSVPKELRDLGVEWLLFSKEMKDKDLTPEDIKRYIEVVKAFKDL